MSVREFAACLGAYHRMVSTSEAFGPTAGPRGLWQVRGGSFTAPHTRATPSALAELPIDTRRDDLGFRTVLDLDSMLELVAV